MGQLPDLAIVVIEDLVLTVVVPHVLLSHLVIDDGGSDGNLVPLNLLLALEPCLDFWLHQRTADHIYAIFVFLFK